VIVYLVIQTMTMPTKRALAENALTHRMELAKGQAGTVVYMADPTVAASSLWLSTDYDAQLPHSETYIARLGRLNPVVVRAGSGASHKPPGRLTIL
jgi:hypothetical protein